MSAITSRAGALSVRIRVVLAMSLMLTLAACGGGDEIAAGPGLTVGAASENSKRALSTTAILRSSTPGARGLFGATPAQDSIDLNGDGKADLLWYNQDNGMTVAWLMDGLANVGGAVLLQHPTFKVVGTADLNGDGKSDLLWYSPADGVSWAWLMDGSTMVAGV